MANHIPSCYVHYHGQYYAANTEELRTKCNGYSTWRAVQADTLEQLNSPALRRIKQHALAGLCISSAFIAIGFYGDDRNSKALGWLGQCGALYSGIVKGGQAVYTHLLHSRAYRKAEAYLRKIEKVFREHREQFAIAANVPNEGIEIIYMQDAPNDEPNLEVDLELHLVLAEGNS